MTAINDNPAQMSVYADQLGPLVEELAHRTAWRYAHSHDPHHSDTYTFNRACLLDFAGKLVSAERERCAVLCDELDNDENSDAYRAAACWAACRIRGA